MEEIGHFEKTQWEQAAQMAALSHEFKTPLSVTLATLDLLKKKISQQPGVCEDEYNVLFGIAVRNIYKVLRMANNFIDVGRLEAGMAAICFADEDIVHLLRQTEKNIAPMLQSRDARLNFVCKTREPFIVQCDAQAMDRILLNLISNSLKHLPQKNGRILLTLEQEEGSEPLMVRIDVTDNGSGICEEAMPHLFEQYWHDVSENSVDKTSTGLGLYLVQALVAMHGGAIAVQSEPYMATTFTIRMPVVRQATEQNGILRSNTVPYDADSYELLLRQELSDFL